MEEAQSTRQVIGSVRVPVSTNVSASLECVRDCDAPLIELMNIPFPTTSDPTGCVVRSEERDRYVLRVMVQRVVRAGSDERRSFPPGLYRYRG